MEFIIVLKHPPGLLRYAATKELEHVEVSTVPPLREPEVSLKEKLLACFEAERLAYHERFGNGADADGIGDAYYGYLYFAYRRRLALSAKNATGDITGDIFKEWRSKMWGEKCEWSEEARDLLTMVKIGRNPAEVGVDEHPCLRPPKLVIKECRDALHHFGRENRPKMKKEDPFCPCVELDAKVTKAFYNLSKEELQKWIDIAGADRERYKREMLAYNSSK
jgi:hypothetical protein